MSDATNQRRVKQRMRTPTSRGRRAPLSECGGFTKKTAHPSRLGHLFCMPFRFVISILPFCTFKWYKQLIFRNDPVFFRAKMTRGTLGKHPVFVGSRTPPLAEMPSLTTIYHSASFLAVSIAKRTNAALLVSLPLLHAISTSTGISSCCARSDRPLHRNILLRFDRSNVLI
jgi:hypothetical protein